MIIDQDRIVIHRKRRQERRCIRCGVRCSRTALCARCQPAWRYCPCCEAVYPVADARDRRSDRATAYCQPCGDARDRARRPRDLASYLAARRAERDRLLQKIIRGYKAGIRPATIAASLGLQPRQVYKLVANARADGRWPKALDGWGRVNADADR